MLTLAHNASTEERHRYSRQTVGLCVISKKERVNEKF